jgi:hypothetical protein
LRTLGFLVVVVSCCSCAGGRRLFPAQGKVFYQGKPTENAIVFLHPLENADSEGIRPHGVVGADGSFRIGTHNASDGAAAGSYAVSIIWKKAPTGGDNDGVNLLPVRYQSPATSRLRVEIREGSNELPPFQLTR